MRSHDHGSGGHHPEIPEAGFPLGTFVSRFALGVVFLWFGLLKLLPGGSPAGALAGETLQVLSLGLIAAEPAVRALGVCESLVGLALVVGWGGPVASVSLFLARTTTPILRRSRVREASPASAPAPEPAAEIEVASPEAAPARQGIRLPSAGLSLHV